MDLLQINRHKTMFDGIQHYLNGNNEDEKIEIWFARELQELLGYVR